ncbi:MAG: beta strand repeat-containing protein, partial [bacterium]
TNTSSTISTATYTVTPSPGAGCANGASFTVTVTVLPLARINGITQVICSEGSINVDPGSFGDNIIPLGTNYTWTSPTASPNGSLLSSVLNSGNTIIATLTNTTNSVATATYTVTPVLTNGCTNSANFTIVVTVNPKVTIPSALSTTICAGATFTVSPTNGGGNIVPANTTYTWTTATSNASLTIGTSGAGNAITGTISSSSAVPLSASFNVIPTPPTGQCGSAAFSVIVTVNPTANINQIFTSTCSGIPVVITPVDVTNGIVPANTRYNWTVSSITGLSPLNGSGASTLSFSATINNTTNAPLTATYTVTPTSPQGNCVGSPFSITITVNPIARITGITAVVCSEGGFTVDPTSFANTIPTGTIYSWSVPASTGSLTWSAPPAPQSTIVGTLSSTSNAVATATYTVTPILLNGCTNSSNFTVVVTVNPRPYINAMTAVFCEGVGFTVTPAVGAPGINGIVPFNTIFNWDAPNVSVGLTGGAAFSGTGIITGNLINTTSTQQTAVYTVTPTAPLGSCVGAPFTLTVTINPSAAISTLFTTVCSGLTFRITPTDGTDGQVPTGASGTTTYTWSAPTATSITGAVAQSPTGVSDIFGTLTNQTNI